MLTLCLLPPFFVIGLPYLFCYQIPREAERFQSWMDLENAFYENRIRMTVLKKADPLIIEILPGAKKKNIKMAEAAV